MHPTTSPKSEKRIAARFCATLAIRPKNETQSLHQASLRLLFNRHLLRRCGLCGRSQHPGHVQDALRHPMCGAILNTINIHLDSLTISMLLRHSDLKLVIIDIQSRPLI
ncbi:hypothetical protein MRB53_016695 [Persea americana]|uniref:Uncharacterized protein n=1 Tax=Persea americana TaxID=3435 RepID=A0ACC2M2J6_PERAE|nr:hypothetical protein MRB53_016695 [Persea americana]